MGCQEKDIEDEGRTRGAYDVYARSEYRGVWSYGFVFLREKREEAVAEAAASF